MFRFLIFELFDFREQFKPETFLLSTKHRTFSSCRLHSFDSPGFRDFLRAKAGVDYER